MTLVRQRRTRPPTANIAGVCAGREVTKALRIVKQLGGDILGVVENMAYVTTPDGERLEVFGPSQGLELVIAANAPLIGKLPLDPAIARDADDGNIESYTSPETGAHRELPQGRAAGIAVTRAHALTTPA